MSFSSVQHTGVAGANAATFGSSVTAGNLLVVRVAQNYTSSSNAPTVTDTLGGMYSLAISEPQTIGSTHYVVAIYWTIAATSGSNTITYTPPGGPSSSVAISIEELSFTGASCTVDRSSGEYQTTGVSLSSGSMTTMGASEFVAGVGSAVATGQTWTAGSGFTAIYSTGGSSGVSSLCAVDKLNVSPGSIAATMTDSTSSDWLCAAATFSDGSGLGLSAAAGSFALSGANAGLDHGRKLTATPGAFALTGEPATFHWNVATLTATPGSFALFGEPAGLLHARKLPAMAGSFALSGIAATLDSGLTLAASAGTFSLTGESAGLYHGGKLFATPGAFALTGEPATLGPSNVLVATPGAFVVGRISHNLAVAHALTASPGSFTLTGESVPLQQPFTLAATPGAFALSGEPAWLVQGYTLDGAAGGYVVDGLAATLTTSAVGPTYYNVYGSSAVNAPINYATPIDVTSGTTFTTGPLLYPGVWSFGVRAANNFGEDQNVDAVVKITLDAAGVDVSNAPQPPTGLRAYPTAGGGVRAEWGFAPAQTAGTRANQPTGFHVYTVLGAGPPSYATPVATVLFGAAAAGGYIANLGPYGNNAVVAIAVRAFNAVAEEQNTNVVSVTALATGPTAVVDLTATPTP